MIYSGMKNMFLFVTQRLLSGVGLFCITTSSTAEANKTLRTDERGM